MVDLFNFGEMIRLEGSVYVVFLWLLGLVDDKDVLISDIWDSFFGSWTPVLESRLSDASLGKFQHLMGILDDFRRMLGVRDNFLWIEGAFSVGKAYKKFRAKIEES
jgi:hypothetical protein